MVETWKDIPGYEGRYQASNLGRIRSVTRSITQISRYGTPFTRVLKGRILRPGRYTSTGHVSVVLGHGKNGIPVHQLVARTFLGPRPDGADVRHLNGDPRDNRVDNLCYGSRTENILDHYRQGKAWRKLTKSQIVEIGRRLLQGETGHSLAIEFGVSESTVSKIKRRMYKSCNI